MFFDAEQLAQPPSVFLPTLKDIRACSKKDISDVISRLSAVYLPQLVRGTTRIRRSSPSLAEVQGKSRNLQFKAVENSLQEIRADTFERSFAIQWLTRFISIFSEVDSETEENASLDTLEQAASLLAVCAGAASSGNVTRTFAFSFPRGRIPKQSGIWENSKDEVHVVLRDAPLESADFSSVGAQTWGASCVLAEMIVENPRSFGIVESAASEDIGAGPARSSLRALELGAGTGLGSLVLAKVRERVRAYGTVETTVPGPSPPGLEMCDTVVATDFHPSVLDNLKINVEVNFPSREKQTPTHLLQHTHQPDHDIVWPDLAVMAPTGLDVVVIPLDWASIHALTHREAQPPRSPEVDRSIHHPTSKSEPESSHDDSSSPHVVLFPPLDTPFDLIIGADIIYEPLHARWIRSCVEQFLRKPRTHPTHTQGLSKQSLARTRDSSDRQCDRSGSPTKEPPSLFHLIIPLRPTHTSESRTVEEVFGAATDVLAARTKLQQSTHATSMAPLDACRDIYNLAIFSFEYSAPELAILSQEDITCDAYTDREAAEEVIYRYYTIGWV